MLDSDLSLLAGPELQRKPQLGRLGKEEDRVPRRMGRGSLANDFAVDQNADAPYAADADDVRAAHDRAIPRAHRDLGALAMHLVRQRIPPCDHGLFEWLLAENVAIWPFRFQMHALGAADRIVKCARERQRDVRARGAARVDGHIGVKRLGERLGDAGAHHRQNPNAAPSLRTRFDRIRSDERHLAHLAPGQRKQSARIRKQHERSRGDPAEQARVDEFRAGCRIAVLSNSGRRAGQRPNSARDGQQAFHLLIDHGLRDRSVLDGGHEALAPGPMRAGHHQVEAAHRGPHSVGRRVPVGNHHAVKAPLVLQDLQQRPVGRHRGPVHRVVRGHDHHHALGDARLERR